MIVASVEAERSIRDCVASILTSAGERNVEVIVVNASRDRTAGIVRLHFPDVRMIPMSPGTLTPNLWSQGLANSNGRVVAFTTGHHVVSEAWIAELSSGLESGAAGAGGPVSLAERSGLVDAAVYFLRYSAFMPGDTTESHETDEIAGDNAIYRRDAIDRHAGALRDGLWDVELHHLLRAEGQRLMMIKRATAAFGQSFPLGVISRHRFAHGKHFGRCRVFQLGVSRLRIILAAPLVPFVLLVRAGRRVKRGDKHLGLFMRCSPIFLWLAACWALGEAAGATLTAPPANANRG